MRLSPIKYHQPSGLSGVELLHLTDPEFRFEPHVHDAYVFWFNGEGGERVCLDGSSVILQPDSFGVVAPGEVHANHSVTEHRTLQSLYVDADIIEDGFECRFRSRLQRDRSSRHLLVVLHRTLMLAQDAFLAKELFMETFALLGQRHGEGRRLSGLRRDSGKVSHAKGIMRERFADGLELSQLASACGCTIPHLVRLFRRETGMTPHAYLVELRLGCAKRLLAGKTPIGEIALDSGFTDQSHLTRRFTARFGVPPGAYRRQICS